MSLLIFANRLDLQLIFRCTLQANESHVLIFLQTERGWQDMWRW